MDQFEINGKPYYVPPASITRGYYALLFLTVISIASFLFCVHMNWPIVGTYAYAVLAYCACMAWDFSRAVRVRRYARTTAAHRRTLNWMD